MKTVLSIFFTLSLVLCQAAERPAVKAFKGMEFYSWQDSRGNWVFALLDGTNRLKTEDEVKRKNIQILGLDDVRNQFLRLAEHEQVYWYHRELKGLAYPGDDMIEKITRLAQDAKVDLHVPPEAERRG